MVPQDGLDYHDQPGALNESWSDVFGSMCKQWVLKQTVDKADWLIGNTIVPQGWKALRSMSNPGTAFSDDPQPPDMSHYVQTDDDNGGVHINSGIPNRAFFLAATNLSPQGSSWDKAGKVWYQAYRLLNADSDFKAAAQATVKAASMLFGDNSAEMKGVSDAWSQVGVLD
jgi:Zn-dependent metalloprotease